MEPNTAAAKAPAPFNIQTVAGAFKAYGTTGKTLGVFADLELAGIAVLLDQAANGQAVIEGAMQ